MLIGGYDINNDVITLGPLLMFVYIFFVVSTFRWLGEIWQLSRRGATGELEVKFKFQRRNCKLSLVFPPCRESATESLLAGYA